MANLASRRRLELSNFGREEGFSHILAAYHRAFDRSDGNIEERVLVSPF